MKHYDWGPTKTTCVPGANIHFPSPRAVEETTKLIEDHGGADLCFGGMGLTGHFAFNDPPASDEPCRDGDVSNSRTRYPEFDVMTH